MRRTKEWWTRLDAGERIRLVWLEKSNKHTWRSDYIPDDCVECGSCGTPHTGYGICPFCLKELQMLIAKANGEAVSNG